MGTRTLVDLLNAEQELQQVRLDLVNTRHDLRRLNVDCLFNAGEEREAFRLTGLVVEGVRL
jgi:adhesin transport system outer membrane protein